MTWFPVVGGRCSFCHLSKRFWWIEMVKFCVSWPWTRPRWAHKFSSSLRSCWHIVGISMSEKPCGDLPRQPVKKASFNTQYRINLKTTAWITTCHEYKSHSEHVDGAIRICLKVCRYRWIFGFCSQRNVRRWQHSRCFELEWWIGMLTSREPIVRSCYKTVSSLARSQLMEFPEQSVQRR